MRRLGMMAVLLTAVTLSGVAFGDAETVDFDTLMQDIADFKYTGDYPYLYLDPDGYWKDDYDDEDPHEWVDPCDNNNNAIYDAVEFAVLSAIFANASDPNHEAAHEGWKDNYAQLQIDLGVMAGTLVPDLRFVLGAYVLLGDGSFSRYYDPGPPVINVGYGFTGSWGIVGETIYGMSDYGSGWLDGAPDEANYVLLPDVMGTCGDADSDGVKNIEEFYALGDAEAANAARAAFVAAVLDSGTTDNGGDPEGLCSGAPEPSGFVWDETLFYNTDNQYVYWLNDAELPWVAAQGVAEGFTIGEEKAAFAGNLATVDSEALKTWLVDTIRSQADGDCWIGGNDLSSEGTWVWVATGVQFWQGLGTGESPAGHGIEGVYSNWNGTGEPNNSGDEDFAEMRSNGTWNDNDWGTARASIVEFSNEGAGYPDTNSDGVPDAWEGLAEGGTPTVPNVVGMDETAATAAIEALELTVVLGTPVYSETVAAGLVISQDPAAGTELDGVTSVTIVLSLGPEPEIFAKQPQGGWFEAGQSLTLEAELSLPEGVVDYQWQKNQADLPGEVNGTLVFDPLAESDTGFYRCVVNDESAKGEFISDEVYLLVAAEGMLPAATMAGLALLSGLGALAGVAAARRKK